MYAIEIEKYFDVMCRICASDVSCGSGEMASGAPGEEFESDRIKGRLRPNHVLFYYFIITEHSELILSDLLSPGNSIAVTFLWGNFPRYGGHLRLNIVRSYTLQSY